MDDYTTINIYSLHDNIIYHLKYCSNQTQNLFVDANMSSPFKKLFEIKDRRVCLKLELNSYNAIILCLSYIFYNFRELQFKPPLITTIWSWFTKIFCFYINCNLISQGMYIWSSWYVIQEMKIFGYQYMIMLKFDKY